MVLVVNSLNLREKKTSSWLPSSLVILYTHTHTPDFLTSNQESAKAVGKVLELSSLWLSTRSSLKVKKKKGKRKKRKRKPLLTTGKFQPSPVSTTASGTKDTVTVLGSSLPLWGAAWHFRAVGPQSQMLREVPCPLPGSEGSSAESYAEFSLWRKSLALVTDPILQRD